MACLKVYFKLSTYVLVYTSEGARRSQKRKLNHTGL